jgi:hypothetical protein
MVSVLFTFGGRFGKKEIEESFMVLRRASEKWPTSSKKISTRKELLVSFSVLFVWRAGFLVAVLLVLLFFSLPPSTLVLFFLFLSSVCKCPFLINFWPWQSSCRVLFQKNLYILGYLQIDKDRWSMVKQLGQVTRDEYLNHLPMHI